MRQCASVIIIHQQAILTGLWINFITSQKLSGAEQAGKEVRQAVQSAEHDDKSDFDSDLDFVHNL
jgi:hypothetical protein